MRSPTYAAVRTFAENLLRFFFRRIEVTGLEHVPKVGGGILVSWHPNGMIDPALIFGMCPREVVFGARHGLFRVPLLGWLMRAIGTVAIYRAVDNKKSSADDRRAANQKSLDALAERVASGSFCCLFPEGDSHDAPHLIELKTGVARFYYRARQLLAEGAPLPVIIPVGLHYDQKRVFRSNVLVSFHPPIELSADLDATPPEDEPEALMRERWRGLMSEIERVLRQVVHATESWDVHHLMHRARKLVRAERALRAGSDLDAPSMEERTRAFARIWTGYYARLETHPEEVAALREKVREYDEDLRALGMEDHELDRGPPLVSGWLAILLLLQLLFVYLLLPPLLLAGYLVNGPSAGLLWLIARAASKKQKDEATVKVLVGALLFPLTWAIAGVIAGFTHARLHDLYPAIPDNFVTAGITVGLLGFLGGAASIRYLRLARETVRSVRVRLTRSRRALTIARLKLDRAELFEALMGMGEGLKLPGSVALDGRIERSLPAPMSR